MKDVSGLARAVESDSLVDDSTIRYNQDSRALEVNELGISYLCDMLRAVSKRCQKLHELGILPYNPTALCRRIQQAVTALQGTEQSEEGD
jgi:hypothetical protein